MARTQKNKATEGHLGLLKAKLAKLRRELLEPSGGGGKGEGFDVMKSGDARIAMIGFPSVGKSTLLSTVTKTESDAASYEFTTLTCIPGVIEYRDAKIQLLDLPGIIEGASKGKGRGRQVIAVARTADMVLMVLDAAKADIQKRLLIKELEDVGIRINQRPPNITYKMKKTGGVKFNSTVELTKTTEKTIKDILKYHKIHNADVLFREDCTTDQFIDVLEVSVLNELLWSCCSFSRHFILTFLFRAPSVPFPFPFFWLHYFPALFLCFILFFSNLDTLLCMYSPYVRHILCSLISGKSQVHEMSLYDQQGGYHLFG